MTTPIDDISPREPSLTHIEVIDDIAVARVQDEIDISNSKLVARELLESIPNDSIGLVIDLAGVRYIDSSGIRMLFQIADALTVRRGHVALSVPDGSPLRTLLSVTHMDAVAPIAPTLSGARDAVRRRAEEAAGGQID